MAKKKNNNEELRLRIIRAAFSLFIRHGIKDIKMDDIAHHMNISKRTIYELFKNKEEIVLLGIELGETRMQETAKQIIATTSNPLETGIILYKLYFGNLKNINRQFFIDLQKYKSIKEIQEKKKMTNAAGAQLWLEKSKQEGLLLENANFEFLQYIVRRDIEFIMSTTLFENYSISELANAFIITYLRGIATPAGIEIIDKYMQEN